jgi:hypothetical protein
MTRIIWSLNKEGCDGLVWPYNKPGRKRETLQAFSRVTSRERPIGDIGLGGKVVLKFIQ